MELALVEKRGQPVRTKFKFKIKEWQLFSVEARDALMDKSVVKPKISKRYVTLVFDGDYLNN